MNMKNPLDEQQDVVEEVSNGQFKDRQKKIKLSYNTYLLLSVSHKPDEGWRKEWRIHAKLTSVYDEQNKRLSEGYSEYRGFDKKKRAQKYFDYLVEKHTDDD